MDKKQRNYTDKFKADCLALLIASDYPANAFKLEEVARHVGVPSRTLRRWFNGQNGSPPDDVVQQEKQDLASLFEKAAGVYLTHALLPATVIETSGNAAIIAAATATDKMRLLRGLPTEIIAIMPTLMQAIEKAGLKPSDVFNNMLAALADANTDGENAGTTDAGTSAGGG